MVAGALTRLILGLKKLGGIGFMTVEDVRRFLDEMCDLFGRETRGECGMKQCPNCGDICTRGIRQGTIDMRTHVAGKNFENEDTEDE